MKFLFCLLIPFFAMAPFPKKGETSSSPIVVKTEQVEKVAPAPKPTKAIDIQEKLISIGEKYTYVRETNGPNRSKEIDAWNKATSVPMGSPYCASFQAFIHREAGLKNPNSAWSPSWFSDADRRISFEKLSKGDVVGLYYNNLKRVGHILMIDEVNANSFRTLEANTSPEAKPGTNADRDGDGVHSKIRSKALLGNSKNKYARYW